MQGAEKQVGSAKPENKSRRLSALNRDGSIFHVVLAQQYSRSDIGEFCQLADMIRAISSYRQGTVFLENLLNYRRAMLYFIQPSTRTFLSFTAACQVLGIRYNEVRDRSTSSEAKGESEDDTIRVLSQYFDVIIMRHPTEGFAEHVANLLNTMPRTIPVLNAGSGKDQHPTQALLDIYTLFRVFAGSDEEGGLPDYTGNPFAGKTIAFAGDLLRGRTVRSLAYLLGRYPGCKLLFVSPPELQIGGDILEHLDKRGIEYEISDDLRKHIGGLNAVYMTRLQDEHDVAGESKSIDYDRYSLTFDMASKFRSDLAILHPLPRRAEIDPRLDYLPQAKYWEQVRNGMWVRAALLGHIFQAESTIREQYHSHYTF